MCIADILFFSMTILTNSKWISILPGGKILSPIIDYFPGGKLIVGFIYNRFSKRHDSGSCRINK
jgi:hypothetical protein